MTKSSNRKTFKIVMIIAIGTFLGLLIWNLFNVGVNNTAESIKNANTEALKRKYDIKHNWTMLFAEIWLKYIRSWGDHEEYRKVPITQRIKESTWFNERLSQIGSKRFRIEFIESLVMEDKRCTTYTINPDSFDMKWLQEIRSLKLQIEAMSQEEFKEFIK